MILIRANHLLINTTLSTTLFASNLYANSFRHQRIGMKHPDTAKVLRLLGNSFYLMGDLSTSEKLLNK